MSEGKLLQTFRVLQSTGEGIDRFARGHHGVHAPARRVKGKRLSPCLRHP